jgi:hypothetical protein
MPYRPRLSERREALHHSTSVLDTALRCFLVTERQRHHYADPRREITQYQNIFISVRFEVFTAVTMKNGVFWDVMPCDSCKNRRFGGT